MRLLWLPHFKVLPLLLLSGALILHSLTHSLAEARPDSALIGIGTPLLQSVPLEGVLQLPLALLGAAGGGAAGVGAAGVGAAGGGATGGGAAGGGAAGGDAAGVGATGVGAVGVGALWAGSRGEGVHVEGEIGRKAPEDLSCWARVGWAYLVEAKQ